MKKLYIIVPVLHWFVGLGAFAGGLAAVLNPESPMGMSTASLKSGPFVNFLIPGLFLMIVIGLFNIIEGFLVLKKIKYHEVISGGLGAVLIGWIVIQCIILRTINTFHIVYFIIGSIQGLLALVLIYKNRAFPIEIVESVFKKK
jgi:hypothetical protein